ncbi:Fur family transcriptional regulator [Thermanaerovibrio acidaminovorans]|uniref:Fur family transcriptional regulator n=1 Tax=Thermanaerovibrio acidaminovorans TaxID=81462 RepID=UPI002492F540|nr:transcriptional repressor [Thermanaerovibrio acidaminovorans]
MWTTEQGIDRLREAGCKITSQRIAIVRALEGRKDHPSAETIYGEVLRLHPSMSIATIYGTLKMMAKVNLVKVLSIDDRRVYFDPNTNNHGHYLCEKCGRLFDLDHIDASDLKTIRLSPDDHSSVLRFELFAYGICSSCQAGEKLKERHLD